MLPCDWLSRVDPLGSCPTREGQSSRRQLYYVIFTLSQVCCITQWQVCRFTLKCTWMWSRRTSTRKNLRPQISQVYFLSPWVNRCLFMLLLQENTCAGTHTHTHIYRVHVVACLCAAVWPADTGNQKSCSDYTPYHRWDTVTAPSCTWWLLLHWLPAPLVSCALFLYRCIMGQFIYRLRDFSQTRVSRADVSNLVVIESLQCTII